MSSEIPSTSLLANATSNFRIYILASLLGGLLVTLLEATDRLIVLNFPSQLDRLLFLCTLALAPIGNLALGLFIAIITTKAKLLLTILEQQVKLSIWLKYLAVSFSVSLPFLLLNFFFPALFVDSFQETISMINRKIINIDIVFQYPKIFVSILIYLIALKLTLLESKTFLSLIKGRLGIVLLIFSVLIVPAFYYLDSRTFIGRYQDIYHVPLGLAIILFSFFISLILVHRFRLDTKYIILAIIPAFLFTFSHQAISKHQAMKSLFWRRGVVVKNYLSLIQTVYDRDGDGFSPFFDGGDYDDKILTKNPLSIDLANNNIDENFLAGDYKQPPSNPAEVNQKPIEKIAAKNILFITIDCLRADHLGCYGYNKALSPNIDKLVNRSIIFENGFSLGTNTGHSFCGIARANYSENIFNDEIPTVAELFSKQGYITATITSPETSKWLQKQGWQTYKDVMLKGFQEIVHESGGNWNSRKLTDHTIDYIKNNSDKPFYLWVHYNDLHAKAEKYHKQDKQDAVSKPMDVYDSNLRFTDKHLGRLFDYLETTGLFDNTVIAISADHGEEFGEHGQSFHNGRPYRVQTHVPVILYYPGVTSQRINQAVSNIDFAPTFLRLTGQLPPKNYNGVDLVETAKNNVTNRQVFMETPRNVPDANFFAWAMVDGDWRLIYDIVGNTFELYNTKLDPLEQNNLIDKEIEKTNELKKKFGLWFDYQTQDKNYRYWQRF
ncbi:MAG: sulfatase-like hydrolase/transferase [Blastocatellia bacterium]|nr:sulfatase-like hydrolase/transferase [Blastocatellia bacterium]